jgi:uncharacterized membrane protein
MNKENLPKINIFILGLIIIALIVGALAYGQLPDKVPTHWNLQGEVDNYSGRFFGAFGLPLITLGIYLLMIIVPRIDPKRSNYSKFPRAYNAVIVCIVLFMLYIYTITLFAAFNYPINIGKMVRLALGIMFIVLGNYMTQARHNYTFGIRVPWTLASPEVWKKTHRVGGKLFVIAGIIILLSIFVNDYLAFVLTIGSLIGATVLATIYSYVIYKKEKNG